MTYYLYIASTCFVTKVDVFCSQRRPFEGMRFPAPCATKQILTTQYSSLDVCKSKDHNHRYEIAYPTFMRHSVPCSSLKHKFPFVERTTEKGITRETLRLGPWTINSVVIPQGCGRDTKRQVIQRTVT